MHLSLSLFDEASRNEIIHATSTPTCGSDVDLRACAGAMDKPPSVSDGYSNFSNHAGLVVAAPWTAFTMPLDSNVLNDASGI